MTQRTDTQAKPDPASAQGDAGKPKANTPNHEDAAARRSGQVGADKPDFGKPEPEARRPADKRPNTEGPEFEEGGQYPGKRPA